METFYQIIIVVFLIVGIISFQIIKIMSRVHAHHGGYPMYPTGVPGTQATKTGNGFTWIIVLCLFLGLAFISIKPNGNIGPTNRTEILDTIPDSISTKTDTARNEYVPKNAHIEEDVVHDENRHTDRYNSAPSHHSLSPFLYAFQWNAYSQENNAHLFEEELSMLYQEVHTVYLPDTHSPFKVITAPRKDSLAVVQWLDKHPEAKGKGYVRSMTR